MRIFGAVLPGCRGAVVLASLLGAAVLSGCGGTTATQQGSQGSTGSTGSTGTVTPAGYAGPALSGAVLAGSAPLVGAQVQVFAAGTAGNGSAPTPLLAAAVTTDTAGHFNVAANSYNCPSASSMLYALVAGGHVGSSAANSATTLTTAFGACASIGASAAFTINELSTVATAHALRPFLAPGGKLGATATNADGLALGVGTLSNLLNVASGTSPGPAFPSNGVAPTAKLDTLANLLHGCVIGSSQANGCTALFSNAATSGRQPANTFDAALAIANSPGANVAALYGLASQSVAFTPVLSAAPPDWMLAVPFSAGGLNGPTTPSVDSKGNVWVANYVNVASLFTNTGSPVFSAGLTGYGLQASYGGAIDASDRIWIANEQSNSGVNGGVGSVTLLNAAGPALAGNSLFSSGGLNYPIAIAFTREGLAWIVDYGNSHLTVLDNAGTPLSGSAGYVFSDFAFPVAVATDSKGNAWIANQSGATVSRVAPAGSTVTSFAVGDGPSAVAVDGSDNVWTGNFYADSVGLVSAGGAVLSSGGFKGGGLNHPTGIAADGAGNLWVANYRAPGISELAGAAASTPGAALSPSAGWAPDVGMVEPFGIAVDAAGNVWVTSYGDNRLVEFVGVATPVKTPLLGGVRVP